MAHNVLLTEPAILLSVKRNAAIYFDRQILGMILYDCTSSLVDTREILNRIYCSSYIKDVDFKIIIKSLEDVIFEKLKLNVLKEVELIKIKEFINNQPGDAYIIFDKYRSCDKRYSKAQKMIISEKKSV